VGVPAGGSTTLPEPGLLLNLLPILAVLYISAKLLGWLLFEFGAGQDRQMKLLFGRAKAYDEEAKFYRDAIDATVEAQQARACDGRRRFCRGLGVGVRGGRRRVAVHLVDDVVARERRRAFRLNFASHVREATSVTATQPTPHLPASQAANRWSSRPNQ
jgi:hypothetical protein